MVPFDVPGRHDRSARQVLLRPAREPGRPAAATRSTSGSRSRAPTRRALWGARGVPRLGRLQPSRRDRLAARASRARPSTCANPRGHVAGQDDARLRPGPIPPARWAAELGRRGGRLAVDGDADGKVAWRVEIELSRDPGVRATSPTARRATTRTPGAARRRLVRRRPARPRRALRARRRHDDRDLRLRLPADRRGRRRARLRHPLRLRHRLAAGGRSGATRRDHPGKADHPLAPRSSPTAATPNNHASAALRRLPDRAGLRAGAPTARWSLRRGAAAAARAVRRRSTQAGGFTQINHPTIFPSSDPDLRAASAAAARGTTRPARPTTRRSTRSRSRPGRRA